MTRSRQLVETALLVVTVASITGATVLSQVRTDAPSNQSTQPWSPDGVDTLAVLLVSAGCPACSDSSFVRSVNRTVNAQAALSADRFHFAGVAVDWNVRMGLNALEKLGPFSEVSAGNNWANTAMFHWVWSDSFMAGGVPQLLIVERHIRYAENEPRILVDRQKVADRLLGAVAIKEWMEARRAIGVVHNE